HRVPGGQHGGQAAGPDQVQRLDDEVVVDAVPGPVVPLVVQGGLGERDVADRQVVAAVRVSGSAERFRQDLRLRVQRRGNVGGHRIHLDPGHLGAVGGEGDEVAAAAAGL